MLYRIAGRSGSGKTEYIKTLIGEKSQSKIPCVVIVPVQQSMEYEKDIFTRFGSSANLYIEVLTFDRLPNRTYREYGGLAASYVDDGGRALLMAHALHKVKDKLNEFSAVCGENAFVRKMLDTSRTLKENGISHALLDSIGGESRTEKKAKDVHIILSEYDRQFNHSRLDGRNILDIYAKNLKTMDFFRGKDVFVDSFNSFTEQQHRVLDEIAAQCQDIYITFNYDPADKTLTFATTASSFNRVARNHKATDIFLDGNKRAKSKSLEYAEANLWDNTAKPYNGDCGMEFFQCSDRFEESECVSSVISRLVRQGCRYKDIAVITRSPESYAGIIDAVLEKHSIPCFFSSGDTIMVKPLTTFLLSACEAVAEGYPLHVMLKFIKSGFLPLSARQVNILCRYASTWRIRGKAWVSGDDFLMNPSGYREVMSKYDENLLAAVNAARQVVSAVLGELESELTRDDLNGEVVAKALYKLLESVDASRTIRRKAGQLRASGDESAAQKMTELWDVIINALDQIYLVAGKNSLALQTLPKTLELLFDTYTVGSVPASCDEVEIGNAAIYRGNNPKAVIMLGVNDGVFPASPTHAGVFDSRELDELEKKGITLEDSFETQLDNERLFFYLTVAMPAEKLFCIYSEGEKVRPSVGAIRLMKLFPSAKVSKFGKTANTGVINGKDIVFSKASARENAVYASANIKKLLSDMGINDAERVKEHPISNPDATIKNITSSYIHLSPTSLDKYTSCGFSYFSRFILKLTENTTANFAHAEIGTFVHKVLEIFISSRVKGNAFVMPTDDEIETEVERLTNDYILAVCGFTGAKSKRLGYTLSRLKITLKLLLKNISEELAAGLFVPAGFEITLEGEQTTYTTEKGVKVSLSGKIDRVDIYKKGDRTYVRVVDYKSGNKVFNRTALDNGLDLQMFVYLFAYCAGIKNAIPAGVTYLPARIKTLNESQAKGESIEEIAAQNFKRSGIILADRDVIDAMEPGEKKKFLPVSVNKDGSLRKSSTSLADIEEFGKLEEKVKKYIKKVADLIYQGEMKVSPLKITQHDSCQFCSYQPVCRLSGNPSVVRRQGFFNETEDFDNGR